MAGILEEFRLDLSDDFDITFAEVNKAMSILISTIIEDAPGRQARQKVVNKFAKLVQENRPVAEEMMAEVVNNLEYFETRLKQAKADRYQRACQRDLKKLQKFMNGAF